MKWATWGSGSAKLLAVLSTAAMMFAAPPVAAKNDVGCSERSGVLGVSRVLEVDTTTGPRFGNMQYKDIDFLKPGEVVLTFDDGPLRPKTTSVLNALEAHCTKATFFMVGRMALVDPSMVKEIDRRGHTVATHSWSHKMQGRLSKKRAEKEFELGVSAVSLALGKPVAPFFRFPYLSDPRTMQAHLKQRAHGNFSIDIDSLDFRTRSGTTMVNRVLRGLKSQGKGILLFHDIQRSTASGVRKLLDELARRGYKVVHLVPKHPATTLKKYDDMALKEAARRKKVASSRPLASRSIVWPVSNADYYPAAQPLKIYPRGLFRGPLPERSGLVRSKAEESLRGSHHNVVPDAAKPEKPEAPALKPSKKTARASKKKRVSTQKAVKGPPAPAQQPDALKGPYEADWVNEAFKN
ncbi:MAG: polysaccharide deacetylase family protein [Alphaproteobacteria bacterium]|nr:polysaccharide deacetylase family protein [Alphaproteobacteria bacterium]